MTVPAGDIVASFAVHTNEDTLPESHETVQVALRASAATVDAGAVLDVPTALGLIVDPTGPGIDVPLFAPSGHDTRLGFLRVINRSGRSVVHVDAIDDDGNRHATSLGIDAGETVHFNSNDLENGNPNKGLSRGVGDGAGDWRLQLRGNDVHALTYMRTKDGFLTSLHDLVPAGPDGYAVPIFNPGKNRNQVSLLRLINTGEADATVTITGIDDTGASSAGEAVLDLAPGEARTIPADDLEKGTHLDGPLGVGIGKWRLLVSAEESIGVASLLESPAGHLTNLSTSPDNADSVAGGTAHHVYLFPSASDPGNRQGFVRVVNRGTGGTGGTVEIQAYDGTAWEYDPVALTLDANEVVHFNSDDLETGNADKGLSGSTGAGEGDWRLVLTSDLDLDVLAYIRTDAGFLTSMHDTVPLTDGVYRVPMFNPGSNRNQVSLLWLFNPGREAIEATIAGVDDGGVESHGRVQLSLAGGATRTISAQDLETGAAGLSGALGDGIGKWRLEVRSDAPIRVMSLLGSPTGHLTNLSTIP